MIIGKPALKSNTSLLKELGFLQGPWGICSAFFETQLSGELENVPVCAWPCLNPAWLRHAPASQGIELPRWVPFDERAWDYSSFTTVWYQQCLSFHFVSFLQYVCLSLLTNQPTALGDCIAHELADGPSTLGTIKPFSNSPKQNLFLRGHFICTSKARWRTHEIRRCFQICAASWF